MIPVKIIIPHHELRWCLYDHAKLREMVHIYKTKTSYFTHLQIGFHTHIIHMSHKMMCREVEDLTHGFGNFRLNGVNTPWVLSRLTLMLNFWFWFRSSLGLLE